MDAIHMSGKATRMTDEEALFKFLGKFENGDDKDIVKNFKKFLQKGTTVYWAYNPLKAELEDRNEIIYNLDRKALEDRFYELAEEV